VAKRKIKRKARTTRAVCDTNSGVCTALGDKVAPSRRVDEPEEERRSLVSPGTVVDQSEKECLEDVEAIAVNVPSTLAVCADGNSRPTPCVPPTTDWPRPISSKEIFGSVEEDEETEDYLNGEEPLDLDRDSSYRDCHVNRDMTDDADGRDEERLWELLASFADVFGVTTTKGAALVEPFSLEVDDVQWRQKAAKRQARVQSPAKMASLKKSLAEMEANGVIERSQEDCYSHVLLVLKGQEEYRLTIDFRVLNECSKALGWPIPRIKEIFLRIAA
jgi:hypothetical protein